jgi:hypothetical protein
MKFRLVVAVAIMSQGLALLDLSAANANVILTYTGNDFNTFQPILGSPVSRWQTRSAIISILHRLRH